MKKLDVKPNIDRLHAVVTEARARKQAGYEGKDVWKEELDPGAAARAQILPLLVTEKERLKAQLDEVCAFNSGAVFSIRETDSKCEARQGE